MILVDNKPSVSVHNDVMWMKINVLTPGWAKQECIYRTRILTSNRSYTVWITNHIGLSSYYVTNILYSKYLYGINYNYKTSNRNVK